MAITCLSRSEFPHPPPTDRARVFSSWGQRTYILTTTALGENSLWNVQAAILTINQTYEINIDLASFNYRSHVLFDELRQQVELYACSGGVWTQTTDVEGEVNGLLTYDRRIERVDVAQWQADIQSLYTAAAGRGGFGNATAAMRRLVA